MGLFASKPDDARSGASARRPDDRGPTRKGLSKHRRSGNRRHLIAALLVLILPQSLGAQDILRIASFAAPLSRAGPGVLLRDITKDDDAQVRATLSIVDEVSPDILLLTDIDFDAGLVALKALNSHLANPFPHVFALAPNAGLATGLDMDGNGRAGEPRDAQGYGRFFGDGGLAVLSRLPIDETNVQDFSSLLWRDLPGATLPVTDGSPFPSAQAQSIQRLSSTGHWAVPVIWGNDLLDLLVFSATPPVFDGPEDRNGLRNRDELLLWRHVLDGRLGQTPMGSFVVMGNSNLDPVDGDGFVESIETFLADPRLQDPRPRSIGGAVNPSPGHLGDPALDTVDWDEAGPGNLRVTYVLPSADLNVADAGVFWPGNDDEMATLLGGDGLAAGPHRLVWMDVHR